jgi:hypothetical protein
MQHLMWYSYLNDTANQFAIAIETVIDIIDQNKRGVLPERLEDFTKTVEKKAEFDTNPGQDDLNRFDNQ